MRILRNTMILLFVACALLCGFSVAKELREKDYPWEEWFIQFDEPVHHVLFMHDQEICNAEAPIPEGDTQHPAEICGRTWYYYDDKNSYPHFAGKAEPR